MPEPITEPVVPPITPAAPVAPVTPPVTPEAPVSVLDGALDEAGQAENKRLMEADEKTLNDEEKAQRKVLVDAKMAELAKTIPEKYEVKLPEGFVKEGDMLEKMTPVFKEVGLTGAALQKLVDVYAPLIKQQTESQQKSFNDAQEANFKSFNDSEKKNAMEKLGANAKTELVFAAKSRDRFFSKESQELLNATGIANNFNFISDLIKIGRSISEAKLVDGKQVTVNTKTDGEVLYGTPEEKAK